MGIKSSSTCVMHYNDAKAWLVGDLNKGMKAMHMETMVTLDFNLKLDFALNV